MSSPVLAHEVKSAGPSKAKYGASTLRVNRPDDTYEREADRVAEVVSRGGRVASWSLSTLSQDGVQRQAAPPPPGSQTPVALSTGEMIAKVAEAILATKAGKDALQAVKGDPLVKAATDFVTTPAGIVIAGSSAVGVVSALAASHTPLPLQIPKLPLDMIHPGLAVKITYEGPVNRPTAASLTLSYEPKASSKKPKQTESEKFKAETSRLAADQAQFRAGMHQDRSSAHDPEADREKRVIEKMTLDRMGAVGKAPDITRLGAGYGVGQAAQTPVAGAPDKGLKLPTFESPFKPKAPTVLDKKLELKPMTHSAPEADAKKKEEIPVQRKAEAVADIFADSGEVDAVLRSPGRPLDPATRHTMESRIGFDFSKVRVYTDDRAAASARSLGARAYTVGSKVVFAVGRYAPESTAGRKLIAHELTHVVQQSHDIARKPAGISPAPRHVQRKWSAGDFPGVTWLIEKLRGLKGYSLFCTVIGQDLFSGEPVERNATTLTQSVLGLFDGGPALFEKLKRAGAAIETAYNWLLGELTKRQLTEEGFNTLLDRAFAAVDKWHPIDSADRVMNIFREPLEKLLDLATVIASKVMDFIIQAALEAFPAGKKVYAILQKAGNTLSRIIADPISFAKNLFAAVQQGFKNFGLNILKHLGDGLKAWIFEELAIKGVSMPTEFTFASILHLILQVLGLTYEQRRPQLMEKLTAPVVYFFETSVKIFERIRKEGFVAIWDMIKEKANSIFDSIIDGIKNWVIEQIVTRGLAMVAALATPIGEFIEIITSIYETLEFIVEKASKLAQLVKTVVDALSDIVEGNIGPAAQKVEDTLSNMIPLLLRFLAGQLHLTGIGASIRKIIDDVRKPIDEAIGKVLDIVVETAKPLWEAGKAAFMSKLESVKEWWTKREKFFFGEEEHDVVLKGDGKHPEVYVHSDEETLTAFLERVNAAKTTQGKRIVALSKKLNWATGADQKPDPAKDVQGAKDYKELVDALAMLKKRNPPVVPEVEYGENGKETNQWGGGTSAKAFLPNGDKGSSPDQSSSPEIWADIEYFNTRKGQKKVYIRGHLLNMHLGGKGEWKNLMPITYSVNKSMSAGMESPLIQAATKGKKAPRYYRIEVSGKYKDVDVTKIDPKSRFTPKHQRALLAEQRMEKLSWKVTMADIDKDNRLFDTKKPPVDQNGSPMSSFVADGGFAPPTARESSASEAEDDA
jgi:hypothetical protein